MDDTSKKENRMSRPRQRKFLVLLLVTILGVCVGAAWYMTVRIDAPTHQGIEIMRDIRTRKLLSFWGEQKTYHQYYFIYRRAGGKLALVGWKFVYRGQNQEPQKGFVGGEFGWERFLSHSAWTLTNGLDKGTYKSSFLRTVGNRYVNMKASIDFNAPDVQVWQDLFDQKYNSGDEVPANYVPEGALPLVYREVARRKTHAKFKTIFDSLAPVGPKPRFATIELEYLTTPKNNPAGAILEVKSIVLSSSSTRQIVLDAAGNVVSEESDSVVINPVSEKQFAAVFPVHAYSPTLKGLTVTYPNLDESAPAAASEITVDNPDDVQGGE